MKLKQKVLFLALLLLIPLSACAGNVDEETMYTLSGHLKKVSKALNSAVVFKNAPEALSGPELLDFATRHDPALLTPFNDFTIRVNRTGKASGLLVCDAKGEQAYLEDTSCTSAFDSHLWRDTPNAACEFHLDIVALCGN
ncbi:hypothetical protein L2D14_12320 [Thalassospiraceae bacterium LMO-JJ14]|nr:hypothetical protein L2D14_12320 [Thalassospiraceae bacterium LMO-JJ14]